MGRRGRPKKDTVPLHEDEDSLIGQELLNTTNIFETDYDSDNHLIENVLEMYGY